MMNSPHHWFLYSDRPINLSFDFPKGTDRYTMRAGTNSSRWKSTIFTQINYPKWAKADNLDVFWSPRHQLPLRMPRSLPTVVTLHDLVFKTHPETMTRGGALLERLLTPASLRKAHCILTTSETMKKELHRLFPKITTPAEVAWLASSVNPESEFDEPDLPLGTRYALFCGSLEPRKNLARLLKAIVQINAHSPAQPLHLVIITGASWKSEKERSLINQHSELFHLRESISERAKAGFLRNAWCLALPSLQEGFGIPLVEAMKFGVPIITSKRGALPEIAGDSAAYVDAESVESIIAGFNKLQNSTSTYQLLSRAALERGQLFSWSICAQKTHRILEAACTVSG